MPRISDKISYGLDDYFILTGCTTAETTYDKVDLTTQLAPNVILRYPFIAAAMSCLTKYEMTLACANNGIIAVVPCSLPTDEQTGIVERVKENEVKKGQIEFVHDPVWIRDDSKVKDAIERYNEHGHSVIPICDDFRRLGGVFKYKEGTGGRLLDQTLKEVLDKARNGRLREIFLPFDRGSARYGQDYCLDTDGTETIYEKMKSMDVKYLPIIDKEEGRLIKLAFIYKYHGYMVGGAIHTHPGWEKRVEKLLEAGTDMIFIDSSHAKTDFQVKVLKEFKKKYITPICGGNIIDAEGYRKLVDAGADLVKCGMGSGGSCITTENRGVGRGMATILDEVYNEREKMNKKIPIIADGGIGTKTVKTKIIETPYGKKNLRIIKHDPSSINKSLAWADAVMLGTGFNVCKEAAGDDLDYEGIECKGRWGEGSVKAATLARYGLDEDIKRAFIEEGIDDYVTCEGAPTPGTVRLKPTIEKLALNAKMTFSNVGARNPEEYREKCVLELVSGAAKRAAGTD